MSSLIVCQETEVATASGNLIFSAAALKLVNNTTEMFDIDTLKIYLIIRYIGECTV